MAMSMPGFLQESGKSTCKLIVYDASPDHHRLFQFRFSISSPIHVLKTKLVAAFRLPSGVHLTTLSGLELKNHHTLMDYHIWETTKLIYTPLTILSKKGNIETLQHGKMYKLVYQVQMGIEMGIGPELAMEGMGGSYFMKNHTYEKIAVFKPQDEEPYGPCNPRGIIGKMKKYNECRRGR